MINCSNNYQSMHMYENEEQGRNQQCNEDSEGNCFQQIDNSQKNYPELSSSYDEYNTPDINNNNIAQSPLQLPNSFKQTVEQQEEQNPSAENSNREEPAVKNQAEQAKTELDKTKSEQGFIGKAWDGFKNLTGIGDGSDKAEQAIKNFENGKISRAEMDNAIKGYKEGQIESVDIAADIISGITAFTTFALSTGVGLAAAPFTGGASLGLIGAGFALSGATGGMVKAGIKKLDCAYGGREYNSFGYDVATGGINGLFAPVTAGLGGAAGKLVAGKVGVNAVKEGSDVILKNALNGNVKSAIAKTLLTTNVSYSGGSTAAKALALGTDMAVNGSSAGAVDSTARYLAGNNENKSLSGLIDEVKSGAIGGLIFAPVIGGGMRLLGNLAGGFTGKLGNKIYENYDKAKQAVQNNPEIKNQDMDVLNGFCNIYKEAKELLQDIKNQDVQKETVINNINKAFKIVKEGADNAEKIPDTDMYRQLGDFPDRAKQLASVLQEEGIDMDSEAAELIKKLNDGNINGAYDNLENCYDELALFRERLGSQYSQINNGIKNGGIDESAAILRSRLRKLMQSENFLAMSKEEQFQVIMENSNILFSKFAQTYSSNENLPPEVSKIFKQFTSNCTVSRDLPQAQSLADELYGKGKYTIKKSYGAGTIGETYLAETKDGTEVVIKMLKDGVTPEKFKEDRKMLTKFINEFEPDSIQKEYKLNLINGMFDAWDRELNFGFEAQGAKAMADGAERFNVAQTLEVGSKEGKNISLVMEKAKGVRLDSLLEMIDLYRKNPKEYFIKYSKEIEENPALKTPENWIEDLSGIYKKAQNEQVMFVGSSGTRTIHADPHAGNIFVNFDKETSKPNIVYIDTGNVIQRTNSQTLKDLALSINMLFGNSKGTADSLLEGAILPKGADKKQMSEKFTQLLDKRLFKAGVNVKNTQYSQKVINDIMKELNIVPNPESSNLIKATIQRLETLKAINKACGTVNRTIDTNDFEDLARGFAKSLKVNPIETIKTAAPIIKWAYQNNDQAMITFFQMIIKDSEI